VGDDSHQVAVDELGGDGVPLETCRRYVKVNKD